MAGYVPWYYKMSCLRLMLYGALLSIAVRLFEHPDYIPILLTSQEWAGVRPYGAIGAIIGSAAVGVAFGALGYFWIRRRR